MVKDLRDKASELADKVKSEYHALAQHLETERDELKLQMHLAGEDAQDQWHKVERKWSQFQSRASLVSSASHESAKEVGEAAQLLGTEIKEAYRQIRDALKRR